MSRTAESAPKDTIIKFSLAGVVTMKLGILKLSGSCFSKQCFESESNASYFELNESCQWARGSSDDVKLRGLPQPEPLPVDCHDGSR